MLVARRTNDEADHFTHMSHGSQACTWRGPALLSEMSCRDPHTCSLTSLPQNSFPRCLAEERKLFQQKVH